MPSEAFALSEGEAEELSVGPSLAIRVAQSCHRQLTWEVTHTPQAALARLLEQAPLGFEEQRRVFGVTELSDRSGHAIVIVEKSYRTQIRVHYSTPSEQRAGVATEIAERMLAVLGR